MTPAPVLTGLAPDPRQPGYLLVDVDRGRFASLPADAVEPLRLLVGAELTPVQLARLRELADVEAAHRAALRALGRRSHARVELGRRLAKRQHPPQAVAAALDRLAALGLLDDRRFAEQYAAVRAARGKGPARLVADLLAQGVDRKVAEDAVRRALEDEGLDPALEARAVAAKRARQLRDLPPPVRKRRLLAFLVRRGYAGAEVKGLVEELCGGRSTNSLDPAAPPRG
ncbi:MAG TPA: regulatory protein RecX [Gemmatimonadales bacterium]|nr:regulatory protein RecX [Gemmatimonadales bacterium]